MSEVVDDLKLTRYHFSEFFYIYAQMNYYCNICIIL